MTRAESRDDISTPLSKPGKWVGRRSGKTIGVVVAKTWFEARAKLMLVHGLEPWELEVRLG